jgi:hypothetical protein
MRGTYEWLPKFSSAWLRRDLLVQPQEQLVMTRIPAADLNCAFYLYPDEASAKKGDDVGGSGFWVSIMSTRLPNFHWVYAVSNQHVVHKNGASVIRANTRSGGVKIFQAEPTDWREHPKGHDIAILGTTASDLFPEIECVVVEPKLFITPEHVKLDSIGIGDDVYMIGRFVNHDGKVRNAPSVRFGNISMMPGERVYVDSMTKPQESFLVEMRSMCGYSGSPVFVQMSGWRKIDNKWAMRWDGDLLLGVHWGHITEPLDVEKWIVKKSTMAALKPDEKEIDVVAVNTGMNGVVPAWRLKELLYSSELVEHRTREEDEELETRKRSHPNANQDASLASRVRKGDPPANDENPMHREDFTDLVSAAAQKSEPKD